MRAAILMSLLATFSGIYSGNNRDVQDLNGRDLIYDGNYSK
ncbi:MAG: hypothetical protein ACI8RZ_001770 [Myxococcota bacterium]|jgi:hypothetical protein